MGRIATWATLLAVVAVAAAAALDAIRGADERPARLETTAPRPEPAERLTLVRLLVSLGARGRLVTTDARCTVHAIALPSLRETARPASLDPACSFSVSPDGRQAASAGADWSPDGRFVAVCRGKTVGIWVGREHGEAPQTVDGCTPAWRPDGVLTLVRGGALREVRPRCSNPPCERVLLPRRVLRAAAGAARFDVEDVAWLARARVAVLLDAGSPPRDVLAIFGRGRVVVRPVTSDDHLVSLTRSPLGTYVAARPDALFRDDGTRLPLGRLGVRALAFSPDESLIALAVRGRVLVFPLDLLARGGRPAPAELPLVAQDLAWR